MIAFHNHNLPNTHTKLLFVAVAINSNLDITYMQLQVQEKMSNQLGVLSLFQNNHDTAYNLVCCYLLGTISADSTLDHVLAYPYFFFKFLYCGFSSFRSQLSNLAVQFL